MTDPNDPNEVIEGELLPAQAPYLFDGDHDRRSDRNFYDEETITEAIRLVMAGHKPSVVAERIGCSRQALWRWVNTAKDKRGAISYVDMPRVRGSLALELAAGREEAWRCVRAYPQTKFALDALVVINNLIRNEAVLLGLNAPIVVQVDVEQVTAADRELEELINEAKAKAANEVETIKDGFQGGKY